MSAERPVVAALAVVLRASAVVLVRRRNPPDAGLWGFPGGKVELGETVSEAAVRELREETGVLAEALEGLAPLDIIGPAVGGRPSHHFVLIPVVCRWLAGEPEADEDALEAAWFEIAELRADRLPMSRNVAAVARLAARRE